MRYALGGHSVAEPVAPPPPQPLKPPQFSLPPPPTLAAPKPTPTKVGKWPWFAGSLMVLALFFIIWSGPSQEKPQVPAPTPPMLEPPKAPAQVAPAPPAEKREEKAAAPVLAAPPGMVPVPDGEFWMGCSERDKKNCSDDEKPGRTVYLDAFAIDTTEVTVADYRKCVEAGKCTAPDTGGSCNWNKSDRSQHPINCIDWEQAQTYCEKQGKRLPTEAEWEKAARGDQDQRIYPWGNEWDAKKANVSTSGTVAVDSYPAGKSPYGALNMAGNVWEWTADWYDANYYQSSPVKNPQGPESGPSRSLRGGSWNYDAPNLRVSYRDHLYDPGLRLDLIGFHCAE